jgi:hypothetical protein
LVKKTKTCGTKLFQPRFKSTIPLIDPQKHEIGRLGYPRSSVEDCLRFVKVDVLTGCFAHLKVTPTSYLFLAFFEHSTHSAEIINFATF